MSVTDMFEMLMKVELLDTAKSGCLLMLFRSVGSSITVSTVESLEDTLPPTSVLKEAVLGPDRIVTSLVFRELAITVSEKESVSIPLSISRSKVSNTGDVISGKNPDTCKPLVAGISTTSFPLTSDTKVLVVDTYVCVEEATVRRYLSVLRSSMDNVITTTGEGSMEYVPPVCVYDSAGWN